MENLHIHKTISLLVLVESSHSKNEQKGDKLLTDNVCEEETYIYIEYH